MSQNDNEDDNRNDWGFRDSYITAKDRLKDFIVHPRPFYDPEEAAWWARRDPESVSFLNRVAAASPGTVTVGLLLFAGPLQTTLSAVCCFDAASKAAVVLDKGEPVLISQEWLTNRRKDVRKAMQTARKNSMDKGWEAASTDNLPEEG